MAFCAGPKSWRRAVKQARKRRTYRELFLVKLNELAGSEPKLISNASLRTALGWDDEDRYRRIKRQLLDEGIIIAGRGRGGAVGLADVTNEGLKLFISYSHSDEELKDELIKHLEPLRHRNMIEEWHDRKITAGKEWGKEISKELSSADIILLLISIDFINSEYCYGTEMERAIERHQKGEARVIPIILRSCLWQYAPFAKLQALPKDAKAVQSWSDRDEALTDIVDGIGKVAEELLEAK
jgi:TIR domain-containing protein